MEDRNPTAHVTIPLSAELNFAAIGLATVLHSTVASVCRSALDDYLSRRGLLGELDEAPGSELLEAAGIQTQPAESQPGDDDETITSEIEALEQAALFLADRL